jgi:serine/threonine protein kinase
LGRGAGLEVAVEHRDSWERLKSLFDEAVQVEPERRERFVAERCGDGAGLRADLEALLRAHDDAEGLLGVGDAGSQTATTIGGAARDVGTTIGPYKLFQRVGEGGFGVVYMAERQSPIVRKVALKVIKHGMDTAQVVARFEALGGEE